MWLTWALFGNDDGGIYGEKDGGWVAAGNTEQNAWTAIRWWFRNPFHNLFWHVIDWPREKALVLYNADRGMWYERELDDTPWNVTDSHFELDLAPFLITWQTQNWEGYFGWRNGRTQEGLPQNVFGLTLLRKRK